MNWFDISKYFDRYVVFMKLVIFLLIVNSRLEGAFFLLVVGIFPARDTELSIFIQCILFSIVRISFCACDCF